jgi:hypothetical protein
VSTAAINGEPESVVAWERKIPLLTNLFMLKDLALVFGIAGLVLLAFMLLISGGEDVGQMLGIWALCMGIIVGLLAIACGVVLLNRMSLSFEVGPKGILMSMGKKERRLNALTTMVGLLSGSAQAAGAGLLASSREDFFVPWRDVRKVTVYGRKKVIVLNVGMLTPLRVYCTDDNFARVVQAVRKNVKKPVAVIER